MPHFIDLYKGPVIIEKNCIKLIITKNIIQIGQLTLQWLLRVFGKHSC